MLWVPRCAPERLAHFLIGPTSNMCPSTNLRLPRMEPDLLPTPLQSFALWFRADARRSRESKALLMTLSIPGVSSHGARRPAPAAACAARGESWLLSLLCRPQPASAWSRFCLTRLCTAYLNGNARCLTFRASPSGDMPPTQICTPRCPCLFWVWDVLPPSCIPPPPPGHPHSYAAMGRTVELPRINPES